MPGKNVIVKALVLALGLSLIAGIINAQLDSPHSGINGIGCKNCHVPHNTTDKFLNVTQQVPQDIDDTPVNNLCWNCHNDIVAPYVRTHSSITTGSSYWNGNWSMECRRCHWPHQQMQFRTYGSESYLYSNTSTSITSTTLTRAGAGWTADQYKGSVVIPNIAKKDYNYKITGNTEDSLTIAGPMDLAKVEAGDTFAIVYGKLIKSTISTPNSGHRTVKFFQDTDNDSFADGDSTYTGVCEVCHTNTTHFRNDGGGSDPNHTAVGDVVGTKCTICHQHLNGFKPVASGQGHDTHLNEIYGPGISCRDCHGSYLPPTFSDGNTLANTTVCDNCHSPGGTYDGVNDPVIGAKNNWPDGVYETDGSFKTGKEKWCAGCHDNSPANSKANGSGVSARNVLGNDFTYGFYTSGHGSTMECNHCHDTSKPHIDHLYTDMTDMVTGNEDPPNPTNYRFYDGNGMQIPLSKPYEDSDYQLCFNCHDSNMYNNNSNMTTNFRDPNYEKWDGTPYPINLHWYHSYEPVGTSRTCVFCHDPHGTQYKRMTVRGVDIGGNYDRAGLFVYLYLETDGKYYELTNPSDWDNPAVNKGVAQTASAWCANCHGSLVVDDINTALPTGLGPDPTVGPGDNAGKGWYVRDFNTGPMDSVGTSCEKCHGHDPGYGGFQGGGGSYATHSTHTEDDADDLKGPFITCSDCHDTSNYPDFKSGTDASGDGKYDLSETDVCDNCHSPGGTYDGVNDPVTGAKNNWPDGVYNGGVLAAGKEKWCAGCHDEGPANSRANASGVDAPNVIGDEDATTNYGTGYGYYLTGHGLVSGTYPASGAPAASKGCPDCHDLTTSHIDHDARTYTASGNNYQTGYRLKYSMDIPRTDSGMPVSDFALCFECHNSDPYLGVTNNTNFRDDSDLRNDHSYHLTASTSTENKWDSDWDGSTGDSHISCPACHNVHGSPSPAMYRHGELISTLGTSDKVKFMDFRYIGQTCTDTDTIDPMLPDSIGGAGTRFYGSGPGSISKNSVCNMCHNEYWFKSISDETDTGYTRTPLDVANPRITWVDGQAGSAVLSVRFSEGVYNSVSGDLAAGDFSLTDQDNSRTIMSVTHTAGDTTATLTLDSSLDSTDDIGTDTLSAATTTSIYDASNNAMDTTPVTISEDTDPPALSNQSPANDATDIAINSDLTFILSDSSVGVDWTTFSIQLSGNSGYSKTYTDADTSIVSKTGPPDRYIVTVSPDADFGATEVITVTVNVDDMSGNSMTPPAWSFTAGSQGTITFQPSGLVSNPGVFEITPTDGLWADVLDCNDGDTSYVSRCCQWSEAPDENHVFTVDMDDPGAGLKGRPIEGITIGVYARYGNQDEEGGKINIGYSAGSASGWKGETVMSPSSVYNLITMTDNYTGGIYYEDIENLDVSVRRSNAISSGLIVTEVYAEIAFGATIDTTAPAISNQSPTNGSSDIAINSDLTFTISDNSSGINWSTFEIQLSGDKGYSKTYTDANTSVVSKTGTAGSYDVVVNPDTDFGGEEVITVTVNVDDQAGNSLVPPAWSFTSQAAGGPLTLVLHPSGVVVYDNCVTQGGGWDTVLDSNDGYTSAAVCNSYFYYDSRGGEGYVYSYDGTFTVAMDPAGLGGGETIDRVTLYAWVEVDSDYPGDSLFELCFTGTSYCDLTSYNGGFIKISVDHPAPGTLDLDNLEVDGTGWSGYTYYYYYSSSAAYYITEVGVEIVYTP